MRSPPLAPQGALVLVAGILAGCAGLSDDTLEAALTDPGKYNVYTCGDVDNAIAATMARITELEQLISRGSQGAGGTVMSAVAYRSEYRLGRAQLRALKAAAAEKQCVANSGFLSRRSLY
jgi:hypothetical protein